MSSDAHGPNFDIRNIIKQTKNKIEKMTNTVGNTIQNTIGNEEHVICYSENSKPLEWMCECGYSEKNVNDMKLKLDKEFDRVVTIKSPKDIPKYMKLKHIQYQLAPIVNMK